MNNSATAWILSIGLHVGVVGFAYYGLPSLWKEPPTPVPPISIEFVKVAEETRLSAPKEREKEPEAAPKKTSQYAKTEAYQPEASAEAVPTLDAAKSKPKPQPRSKPTISKRQKLVSSVKPRSRPKPPSRFQSKKFAALIDKSVKDDSEIAEKPKEDAKETEAKADKPMFGSFKNKIATASLIEAFRQQVHACWNLPAGAKDVQNMRAEVRVWLRRDGSLLRNPEYIKTGDLSDGAERAFAESARRAVKACEPYRGLPEDRYDEWKVIDFNFDPSEMY